MTSILLTGGTGFVGSHLRNAFREEKVTLLGRGEPTLLDNEAWRYVDMKKSVSTEVLQGGDVLCHLAYSMPDGRENLDYNRRLLDAVNASPTIKRVVLVSSLAVYGVNGVRVIDEESPCVPVGEYPQTKLACDVLWQEGLREDCVLTIVRPGTVVGPDGNALAVMMRHALERPFVGAIKRSILYHHPVHYVAVSNVAAAIRFCIEMDQTNPVEVYIVSDDRQPENKSYATMQDTIRGMLGKRPLLSLPLPGQLLRLLGAATNRPLLGVDQRFSSQKICDAGFADATTLYDEVRRIIEGRQDSGGTARRQEYAI